MTRIPGATSDLEPLRLLLIGAGQRGREVYGAEVLAMPHRARFVAVADPDPAARTRFATEHGLPPESCFADWQAALGAVGHDAVVIATPDRFHVEQALAVIASGRPLLLEKPVAVTAEGLRALREAVERHGTSVSVAHPLRSMDFFVRIEAIVHSGEIGQLVAVDHQEDVGYWHFAHSYVRGSWRRADLASPLILAKACHDLDLITHLVGSRATSVASFGDRRHFHSGGAPSGAPARCTDGCPAAAACPFHAPTFYGGLQPGVEWPASVVSPSTDPAALENALRTGPYGRCVYHCDNDVPDHQATIVRFANGAVATLTVTAFAAENTRIITVRGTRGEIRGHLASGRLEILGFPPEGFRSEARRVIQVEAEAGHDAGDRIMVEGFVEHALAVRAGTATPGMDFPEVFHGHAIAFAAEEARLRGSVVSVGVDGPSA